MKRHLSRARPGSRSAKERSRPVPVITLLTDFGTRDPWVAEMKGVLLSNCPQARIVDLTHEVPSFDIASGAWLLAQAYPAFPRGTIHLGVVDPGVGTARAPLLLEADGYFFIGPDNGLFTRPALKDRSRRVYHLHSLLGNVHRTALNRGLILPRTTLSATFHGRDLFAPAAAELVCGTPPQQLGSLARDLILLDERSPKFIPPATWLGTVRWLDRFGNAVTDLPGRLLSRFSILFCKDRRISVTARTYLDGPTGRPGALVNSQGFIEIFWPRDSAQVRLGLKIGTRVTLTRRT